MISCCMCKRKTYPSITPICINEPNLPEILFTGDRDALSDEMLDYIYNIRSKSKNPRLNNIIHKILNHDKINNESILYINGLSFEERMSVLYIYNKSISNYIELLESNYNSNSKENEIPMSETPPLSTPPVCSSFLVIR
jgi:hypothetical protein